MNLLITGGAGYIGSVTTEEVLARGHQAVVLDDLRTGHRAAIPPGATFYEGDMADRDILDRIFSEHHIDAVLHFAALSLVSGADPESYFANNVTASATLLGAMRHHGCDRFILSSSASVFGEPQYTPIGEGHPKDPIGVYGETKLMFERMLYWYHQAYGLRYNALRYFNAAGASVERGEDHTTETHLIPITIQAAMGKRERVYVYGEDYPTRDGTCVRDYVHVLDLAQAHILALSNLDAQPTGCYNLGNGAGFSVLEVIEVVGSIAGRPVERTAGERRLGDPATLVASSELARRELGWRPRFESLEVIVGSAWEWHRTHPDGYQGD